jgi:peptidoglycan/xylan/chitin deacetylase (PgdA/CDA1 family)
MNKEKESVLTRRDFLKVAGMYSLAATIWPPDRPFPNFKERPVLKKPNPLTEAVKLPSLEYHDPNFVASKDAFMTPDVFLAQLDWLKKANYYTPTAEETYGFLKGEKLLPNPSVVIRFDLGVDKMDKEKNKSVWPDVFENLKKRNLHALVFFIHSAVESVENGLTWKDVVRYVENGTISVCSHGLKDHPDYKTIPHDYALFSMGTSREALIQKLKDAGIKNPQVFAFAFPFDSVPENAQKLAEDTGYSFYAGGTKKNGMNAADFANLNDGLSCIYPYVYKADLEFRKDNANNFLPLIQIKGGLNFIDSLEKNSNKVLFDESWPKYNISLGKALPLPESEMTTGRLVNPRLIVIHTDGQKPEIFDKWCTQNTYNGLNGEKRKILTTFAVDQQSPAQLTSIYLRKGRLWIPEPKEESQGASGIPSAINIEMAGSEFDEIFESTINPEKKDIVLSTIENTADLVCKLIKLSGAKLSLKNVVGHLEVSIKGKSDPGKKTIRLLRRMVLIKLLKDQDVKRK